MMSHVFLSASIPTPGRVPFDQDIQIKRIRDAVLALVTVCKDLNLHLVFGGHPAISPLVHHAAESLDVIEKITIYQSEYYRRFVPEAALRFPNLKWTEPGHDDKSSQANMRDVMINPNNWQYDGAIFIGGMEGIFDEAKRFHKAYPGKPMIPLGSTGGATRMLIPKLKDDLPKESFVWQILESEEQATTMLRYRRMLRSILGT